MLFFLFFLSEFPVPLLPLPLSLFSLSVAFSIRQMDMFEDLRTFPREKPALANHLGRIHHILQKKYHTKVPEFTLRADGTAAFYDFYKSEVQKIITHINHTTGKNYKVRIDPRRLARGFELCKAGATHSPSPPPSGTWVKETEETGRQIRQDNLVSEQRSRIAASIPGHGSPYGKYQGCSPAKTPNNKVEMDDDMYISTAAAEIRRRNENNPYVFSTPPAFNGFQNTSPQ
ncbi:chromosomal passenger protein [Angomonas deanei]|uniref:Chromosomal passenger protein n=1 Tax=Angomonas deanei TaxID=59799 RepID=A0A7G2C9M4_9TRYP|nr:chromosomal passenger protein [Angomonas deanei]CAD2216269.1 hypothetical protein, conserved [Angomonas deanei]|eukprot:EPY32083.1 chromosomal passenger protein [Angomonas deanei]